MVVLEAMCDGPSFRASIHGADLVRAFRACFSEERHRDDVAGTEVEQVTAVDDRTWLRYIEKNPIAAWVGRNTGRPSVFFAWQEATATFRYIGPRPAEPALERRFARAVLDRASARLAAYWQRPGPGSLVFPVIPAGSATAIPGAAAGSRKVCIMFGHHRQGLPNGWHLVAINGRHLYGNFVSVALNVLKAQPVEARDEPNLLTDELRTLFGGSLPPRARVRLVRQTGTAVWEIGAA
jgi:hypothetical protein